MVEELATKKWITIPNFLSHSNVSLVHWWAKTLPMKKANITKGDEEYRGDETYWLHDRDPVANLINYKLEQLKVDLNRRFYLGLNGVEAHIAHYAPGKGYGKHLDATKEDNKRIISVVSYLNEIWTPDDGGYLRLYTDDGIVDIEPNANTAVLFLSEEVEHEVLTSNADRWSIAAWFRRGEHERSNCKI